MAQTLIREGRIQETLMAGLKLLFRDHIFFILQFCQNKIRNIFTEPNFDPLP